MEISKSIIAPSQEDDTEPEATESASAGKMAESVVEAILTMTRRYQDSSVDQLDFSIVNTWTFDPSQEDELRSLIREMASRLFQDEDECQESPTHLTGARNLRLLIDQL